MTLASGARLGPYEIDVAIGAGGMGEVYRARDTRLDRVVAIKILPAAVSNEPERKARFARKDDPLLGSLEADPRYARLLGRLRLPL